MTTFSEVGRRRGCVRRNRARNRSVSLVLGLVLVAPSGVVSAQAHAGPGIALSVSGSELRKDGRPFVPRGFVMRGLLDNRAAVGGCRINDGPHSPDSVFNAVSWRRIRDDWHANTVRIHVSQSGLWGAGHPDKRGHVITDDVAESYADLIERQVTAVTNEGLVVVLSMQDQHQSCGWSDALPSAATQVAWNRLLSRSGPVELVEKAGSGRSPEPVAKPDAGRYRCHGGRPAVHDRRPAAKLPAGPQPPGLLPDRQVHCRPR